MPLRAPILPIIAGPTASGKSDLALALAQRLPEIDFPRGEIVTADSMQVFRRMDIGTAKPTPAQRALVPHHLIDILDPAEPFSVDAWLRLANAAIDDIRARDRTPIVVGGSNLYVRTLLEGLFEGPEPDPALREQLAAMDPLSRRAELERVDPAAAARLHPNDARRTIRALEVFRQTGAPLSALQREWDVGAARPDAALIVLHWPAPALSRRINDRVRAMQAEGLTKEVWTLWRERRLGPQSVEGLGYKQLVEAFEAGARASTAAAQAPPPDSALEAAYEQIKIQTRRFAKNQRTWLRRLESALPPHRILRLDTASTDAGRLVERALHWLRGAARRPDGSEPPV